MDEKQSTYLESGTHIEHIYKHSDVWRECVSASDHFFLLPRYWVTGIPVTTESSLNDTSSSSDVTAGTSQDDETISEGSDSDQQTYRYCQCPEEGTMIVCDNPDRPTE